jgi:hypothetical protein
MSQNGQTNDAPGGVPPGTRRRGGQPGNANAKKPVLAPATLRRRVQALRRRAKAAIAAVPKNA